MRVGIAFGCVLLSISSSKATSSHLGSKKPIETTADSMDIDRISGHIIARGHVVVTYGKIRLLADRARVNTKIQQAYAEGHVRLRDGYKEWTSDSLDYNFETGALKTGSGPCGTGSWPFL